MVASLLMGSIPGVLLGSQLTIKAPTRVLRTILAAVLFLSGLALLVQGLAGTGRGRRGRPARLVPSTERRRKRRATTEDDRCSSS